MPSGSFRALRRAAGLLAVAALTGTALAAPPAKQATTAPAAANRANANVVSPYARAAARQGQDARARWGAAGGTGHAPTSVQNVGRPTHPSHKTGGTHP